MTGFLRDRLRSVGFALAGLAFVLRTQHNAWVHLMAAAVVVILGFFVGLDRADWLWIVTAIALVWFAEVMNTGFEYLCDVVQPGFSDVVRKAKDIAAGAVLITSVYAVIVAALTFGPHLSG
ncbi:diacylglycerol kinase family protein [Frigidibacter sp. RF13]|uniref:diacylglycerol kinase family protein n=1 Tax=Frigidibacter sp. RF13 TaxID=2997340 RepID=UPI002271BA4B|nr:diacylglycerol kinase family protein [Frigidibacter sp. RF13]MCY1127734.1 diacylglycerol kinase family protein [Frigidibacter sp. RF13]